LLTGELVTRAVAASREVLETQIADLHNRINRMEPTLFNRLTASMEQLKELHGEKFKALQTSIDRIMAMESRSSVIGSDHGGGAARPGADDRRLETIQRPGLGRLSAAHRLNRMDFLGHRGGRRIAVMAMEMFRTAH
jgi:hypothetical protein